MHKLLLLMALSILSVKSYATTCPDGSEPIKSISADGTYFVFNCSEPLILDQCEGQFEGQFEGIKQFDPFPTPSVRKKLIVKYQTNGDISIKGDLNLYGIDDLRYTGLYGNIHDGEISGIWGVRNRLKIELIKK